MQAVSIVALKERKINPAVQLKLIGNVLSNFTGTQTKWLQITGDFNMSQPKKYFSTPISNQLILIFRPVSCKLVSFNHRRMF